MPVTQEPEPSPARGIRLPLLLKMLTLLLLLALVPMIVVGTMSLRRGAVAVGQTAEQNLQLIAVTTAARLDDALAQAQRMQLVIATTETVVKACAAPAGQRKNLLPGVERWLREVLAAAPEIALAYLADDQGVCIVSTSPNMVGLDYQKTRDYMRRALAGENVISDLAVGITTREPGIFMAGPVRGRDGRIAGVVVLKLRGASVDRVCQDVSRQIPQGFAVLVDANEVIISHPDPKRLYVSLGTLPPEVQKRIDPKVQYGVERIESGGQEDIAQIVRQGRDRGSLTGVGSNGQPRVGGYARLTRRPWTVGVIQPRAQFDRPIVELAAAQKWWIAGVGLLAALCAAWIGYDLLRPIRSLRAAAMKAAGGDWSARAVMHGNDELGDLARAYNTMMPALEERARIQQDLSVAQEAQRQTQERAELLRAQRETLREAEERTRLILDSAAEGIFGVDTEGVVTFVNPACCQMLGFAPAEMLGQPSHQLIHRRRADGSDYPREQCPMFAAYTRGEANRIDDELLWRKDGTGLPVEYGATPIRKNGAVVGAVISFSDITERKRAEGELKNRTDELQHINFLADSALELTRAGYWHVPLDGSGWYNSSERAVRIFGDLPSPGRRYRVDEWAAHVREGDEAAARLTLENFSAAAAGTIPVYDSIYAYKRPVDGRIVWIHALGNVVKDERGKPTDMFGVTQDITEFKRLESELVGAKETAEAATKAKSDFLANMSHEIRTPMNAVLGMTLLALKTQLTPKQKDYLNKIHISATSLLGIINDILDFSKIEAGKLTMEAIPFNLDTVLENLATLVTVKAQEKEGLEVLFNTAPNVPRALVGDPLRLGQVLINLANNSVKFTEHGEIVVATELLGQRENSVEIRFSIRDSGIGMSAEQQARLFSSFSQADSSITRRYGGTGLGLTISKRLVEMMGGSIEVQSAPGAGSTFSFTATFGLGAEEEVPRLPPPDLRGLKVLVVDDNPSSREILQGMLESFSFTVTQAATGQEGVNAVLAAPYDAVLMDVQMPVMDGYTATGVIRGDERFKDLPIIAMTANAMAGDMEKSAAAGMCDHVTKPIDPDRLFATLAKWVKPGREGGTKQMPSPTAAAPQASVAAAIAANAGAVAATTAEASPFPASLDGFDLKEGLQRLRGNQALYRKLLVSFASKYTAAAGDIRSALDAGDYAKANSLVHDVKGLAGNLSALQLQAAAAELEKLVKYVGEKGPPPPEKLREALAALEASLDQALCAAGSLELRGGGPASAPPPSGLPRELASEAAVRLHEAAELGDVSGLAAIAGEMTSRCPGFAPYRDTIARLADDFDFERILAMAEELRKYSA